MRESPLPEQWLCLTGRVQYVQRVSAKEFSSSCPSCFGAPHSDGTWPDRCRLFTDAHPTLFCRRCGLVAYPDQFGDKNYARPSPEQIGIWRAEQIKREEERKRSAERALQHLRDERTWELYHETMDAGARAYWCKRGIHEDMQDFWNLGWKDVHYFRSGETSASSPTATIPLFDNQWQPLNIKHRIIVPPNKNDRYRYELAGQSHPLFLCDPGRPIGDDVIVVEGEIKAMVMFETLDDAKISMVGLPGLSPDDEIVKQLAVCERVLLVLDPGSDVPVEQNGKKLISPAERLVERIGRKNCRLLIPTGGKIDDIILAANMGKGDVRAMLRQAVPM